MIIRLAKVDDTPEATSLLAQMGYKMNNEQMQKRIEAFNREYHQIAVAEEKGKVIGLIAFGAYEYFREEGRCLHIDALVIDKNHRGLGIGKKLITYAEDYALDHNCINIDLITANRRKEAGTHDFYKALGFKDHIYHDFTYFSKKAVDRAYINDTVEIAGSIPEIHENEVNH